MSKLVKYLIAGAITISMLIALSIGCSKSEVIDMAPVKEIDTSTYNPRTKTDTTEKNDSVPISFTVTVEGWNDVTVINKPV